MIKLEQRFNGARSGAGIMTETTTEYNSNLIR